VASGPRIRLISSAHLSPTKPKKAAHLEGNLNNGGASDDGVVSSSSVARSEHDVALTSKVLGDNDLKATVDLLGVDERGAGDGNEGSVDLALDLVALGGKGDGGAALDLLVGAGGSEHGERLDGQGGVVLGAGGDEGGREGVDLVVVERGVEGLGEGRLLDGAADEGAVARLNGQDRGGGGQVGLRHDVGGGAEVGGNTNALEDRGGGKEALHARHAEVVGALLDGDGAGGGQGRGQEGDVGRLVAADGLDAVVDGRVVAGGGEVGLGEVGETLLVEVVLEVLEGQGVVEDDSWWDVLDDLEAVSE
jgi:hypothetical protein